MERYLEHMSILIFPAVPEKVVQLFTFHIVRIAQPFPSFSFIKTKVKLIELRIRIYVGFLESLLHAHRKVLQE